MSDDARQTPGEPERRDPWAPPQEPAAHSGDAVGGGPATEQAPDEVSLTKRAQEPMPDPWAPPEDRAPRDSGTPSSDASSASPASPSVHDQTTVASMPGADESGRPTGYSAPTPPPSAAAPSSPYGYPGAPNGAVPPPPVGPNGPGQPMHGHFGYPGYSGYPGYGWQSMPPQPSNGLGVTAMVLGIISAVIFCLWPIAIILGILAIIFGAIGRGKAKRGEATNPGQALAGIICGAVGAAFGLAFIVLIIVADANNSSKDPTPDVFENSSISVAQER